jgi:hypothetical protein
MNEQAEYKAVYEIREQYGLFEQDNLNWQAQWFDERSLNPDKYERGGWYATEAEALEAAKRGKEISESIRRFVEGQ